MRVAVLMPGVVLSVVLAIHVEFNLIPASASEPISRADRVGHLLALLMFVGAAFAVRLPLVAMVLFVLAGIVSLLVAAFGSFPALNYSHGPDLRIWGVVSLVFAVIAFIGWREE